MYRSRNLFCAASSSNPSVNMAANATKTNRGIPVNKPSWLESKIQMVKWRHDNRRRYWRRSLRHWWQFDARRQIERFSMYAGFVTIFVSISLYANVLRGYFENDPNEAAKHPFWKLQMERQQKRELQEFRTRTQVMEEDGKTRRKF